MPSPAFNKRTGDLYRSMQRRVAEKRNKRDRIIRVGRTLGFALEEFRVAILDTYGGEGGTQRCRYCSRILNVFTFSPEHMTPLKRGGDLTLSNIDLACCMPCNARKGGLTSQEFIALLDGLKTFPESARADILQRLEIAVQLAASRTRYLVMQSRQPQTQTVQEEDF